MGRERNIARIAKAASHKLPGKSSLNVSFAFPVLSCPVLLTIILMTLSIMTMTMIMTKIITKTETIANTMIEIEI